MVQIEVLGGAGGGAMGSITGWPGSLGAGRMAQAGCCGWVRFPTGVVPLLPPLCTRGAECKLAFIPGKGWGPSLVSDGTWSAMMLGTW